MAGEAFARDAFAGDFSRAGGRLRFALELEGRLDAALREVAADAAGVLVELPGERGVTGNVRHDELDGRRFERDRAELEAAQALQRDVDRAGPRAPLALEIRADAELLSGA